MFPFSTTPSEDQLWFPFSTRPNQLSNQNRRRSSAAQDGDGRVLQGPALLISELAPLSEAIGLLNQDQYIQETFLHYYTLIKIPWVSLK